MRKALIIGIDNYPKSPLYGCVRDAIEMSNVLTRCTVRRKELI